MVKITPLLVSSLLSLTIHAEESFYLVTCNGGAYRAIAHWFDTPDLKYVSSSVRPDFQTEIYLPDSIPWEGWRITGGFTDGTYLQTHILSNAATDYGVGQAVGDANDGIQVFTCFKEDKRPIYLTATGSCKSDYYCHDIVWVSWAGRGRKNDCGWKVGKERDQRQEMKAGRSMVMTMDAYAVAMIDLCMRRHMVMGIHFIDHGNHFWTYFLLFCHPKPWPWEITQSPWLSCHLKLLTMFEFIILS